jgi:hypothetical protein
MGQTHLLLWDFPFAPWDEDDAEEVGRDNLSETNDGGICSETDALRGQFSVCISGLLSN